MADVVKAPVLVVEIAAVGVRVPVVPATKMDIGVPPPPHPDGGQTGLPESGRPVKGNQKAAKWSNGSKYSKLKKH